MLVNVLPSMMVTVATEDAEEIVLKNTDYCLIDLQNKEVPFLKALPMSKLMSNLNINQTSKEKSSQFPLVSGLGEGVQPRL